MRNLTTQRIWKLDARDMSNKSIEKKKKKKTTDGNMKGEWKKVTKMKRGKQKPDTSPNRLSSDVMKTREHKTRQKLNQGKWKTRKENGNPQKRQEFTVGRHITKEIFQHAGKEKGTRPILQWSPGEGMESAGIRRKRGNGEGQNRGRITELLERKIDQERVKGVDRGREKRSLRNSEQFRRFLVADILLDSQFECCDGLAHLESRAGKNRPRKHRVQSFLHNKDCLRNSHRLGGRLTYDFLRRPRIDWQPNKQTRH